MKTIKKVLSTGIITTHKQEGLVKVTSNKLTVMYNNPIGGNQSDLFQTLGRILKPEL